MAATSEWPRARPLTGGERDDRAGTSTLKSPAGVLIMIVGVVTSILGALLPFPVIALPLGFIDVDIRRLWLALLVLAGGLHLASQGVMLLSAALGARLNRGAVVVVAPDGAECIVAWHRHPPLGLVIVVPVFIILWVIVAAIASWIAPGIQSSRLAGTGSV